MGLSLLLSVTMADLGDIAYIIAVVICGAITIVYLNIGGAHGAIFTDAAESIIMLPGSEAAHRLGGWIYRPEAAQ